MGEILNRREQIVANKLPPEIPDPDTLVSKTDYATASKAGVVKIGNNINVSSGKISVPAASDETAGVVKVGENLSVDENGFLNASAGSSGITFDELFNGSVNLGGSTLYDLAHPYTDYKFICLVTVSGNNNTAGGLMPVANLSTGLYNSNGTGNANVTSIRLEAEDATKFSTPSGSGAFNVKIYGIK